MWEDGGNGESSHVLRAVLENVELSNEGNIEEETVRTNEELKNR
jgi:hypothetical protein